MRQERIRERENEEAEKSFPIPIYEISVSSLPFMSRRERQELRRTNRGLPCYMFMDKQEKKIYFKRKAKEYERKLHKMEEKVSPTKKRVQFMEEYDVRPFEKEDEIIRVGETPSFKDTYSFDHFCY